MLPLTTAAVFEENFFNSENVLEDSSIAGVKNMQERKNLNWMCPLLIGDVGYHQIWMTNEINFAEKN